MALLALYQSEIHALLGVKLKHLFASEEYSPKAEPRVLQAISSHILFEANHPCVSPMAEDRAFYQYRTELINPLE
jgi:hypothetical protein